MSGLFVRSLTVAVLGLNRDCQGADGPDLALSEMLQKIVESRIHVRPEIAQTRIANQDAHKHGERGNAYSRIRYKS